MIISSSIKKYSVEFHREFNIKLLDYRIGDVVIIDSNVSIPSLDLNGVSTIKIEATEKAKSYDYLPVVIDKILSTPFNRESKLIAIGGGVTQDIVSFISSILFRGVDWNFIPTTALAQGDSCIGGKTSINYRSYKNQLGNFNPPNKVIVCDSFLDTLSEIEMVSGLGEMLHFYLVSGELDFEFYKEHYLTDHHKIIKRCLEIKKGFVEEDEFDKNTRLLLNYGHTFGHAIESITDYKYPHGISVCFGMDIANFISMKLGLISKSLYKELNKFIFGLIKIECQPLELKGFVQALKKDKKNNTPGFINCVITKGIGSMFLMNIEIKELETKLEEYGFNK